jgi:hypothetical protein
MFRAGVLAMTGWAALGVLLGVVGVRRLSAIRRSQEQSWKALEARVAAENPPPTTLVEAGPPPA